MLSMLAGPGSASPVVKRKALHVDRSSSIIRFGNDGWHARFDEGFDATGVARMGDALGAVWAEEATDEDAPFEGGTVYVGFDSRHDSETLALEAAGVIASYGIRVVVSNDVCPTPAVAWACHHDPRALGGVIVTASERSCEYGGMLVRNSDGGTCTREFFDRVEQEVEKRADASRGEFERADLLADYRAALLSQVGEAAVRPLKVVVDPMFGAGTGLLASLLRELGHDVEEIHGEYLEDFDGIHPDPRDPWADACEQAVVAGGADLGVLLDGDGDRAAVVDQYGTILAVRELVPLLLEYLVAEKGLSGRVISTLTSSASIERQAKRLGLDFLAVPVGFSRIYREVQEGDVLLGAEEYGGICLPAHLPERDGLLVCLLAVQMVSQSGISVRELVDKLDANIGTRRYTRRDVHLEPEVCQVFRNVLPGLNPPEVAGKTPVDVSHADGLRLDFDDDAWVLMRPSRADAVVRVYAEAPNAAERDELLEAACDIVRGGY